MSIKFNKHRWLGLGILAILPLAMTLTSHTNVQASQIYRLKVVHNAYLYNAKGKKVKRPVIKKHATIKTSQSKIIKDTKYLKLKHGFYIKASNVKIPKKSVRVISYSLKPDIQEQIQNQLNQMNFQGNFTVYHQGQKAWTYTTANQANSAYLINSVQKFLTGGLIMQAAEHHQLSLDDHLDKYYPQIPGAKIITIRDLLNMHSGLTLKKGATLGKVPFVSDEQTLEATIPDIQFDQNLMNKFDYETVNYAILSNIVEKATHQTYQADFTKTYIEGQKLNNTAFVWDDQTKLNQINFVANPMNLDEVHGELGAGSVAMSNDDLFRIAHQILTGKIISASDVDDLYQLSATTDGSYHGGFYAKDNFVYANGADFHYYTFLRISKDGQNGLVYQTNQGRKYYTVRRQMMDMYQVISNDDNFDQNVATVKKPIL